MKYKKILEKISNTIPSVIRDTAIIRMFGFVKIPMLFFTRPIVKELSDENCIVKIPLNRKTKNHLNSMYFGVLAVGADCAGGLSAMREITKSGKNISLSFKNFKANFLKRAEGDTYFSCYQGLEIKEFVEKVIESGERHNMTVFVEATCPSLCENEPVAKFELTLSLKLKQ